MQLLTQHESPRVKASVRRLGILRGLTLTVLVSLCVAGLSLGARAQDNASVAPLQLRGVGIDQRLNNQIPLDLKFRDETGKTVRLGSYFGKKPVILSLVYYSCPMLCTMAENGLLNALRDVKFNIGEQFEVVTVSIDPTENPEMAMGKKAVYVGLYGRPAAKQGWHFLVGDDPNIRSLAQAVGFQFRYLADVDLYDHPAGIMVLTPKGKVSRYFYGVQYAPRDLQSALVDASNEKIGNPRDMEQMLQRGYSTGGGAPAEVAPAGSSQSAAPPVNHLTSPTLADRGRTQ